MAVYVDEIRDYRNRADLRPHLRKLWCHMFADSPDELHAMAERIGLRREWFQDQKPNPEMHHYDVQPAKRAQALRLGAVEVDSGEYMEGVLERIRARRKTATAP